MTTCCAFGIFIFRLGFFSRLLPRRFWLLLTIENDPLAIRFLFGSRVVGTNGFLFGAFRLAHCNAPISPVYFSCFWLLFWRRWGAGFGWVYTGHQDHSYHSYYANYAKDASSKITFSSSTPSQLPPFYLIICSSISSSCHFLCKQIWQT